MRPFIEKVITLAKKAVASSDSARKIHYRRLALSRVRSTSAVARLFDELVDEFTERSGGYTRIYKLGQRIGDAAEMGLIEFIDKADTGYTKGKGASKAEPAAEAVTDTVASATESELVDNEEAAVVEPAVAEESK